MGFYEFLFICFASSSHLLHTSSEWRLPIETFVYFSKPFRPQHDMAMLNGAVFAIKKYVIYFDILYLMYIMSLSIVGDVLLLKNSGLPFICYLRGIPPIYGVCLLPGEWWGSMSYVSGFVCACGKSDRWTAGLKEQTNVSRKKSYSCANVNR